MASEPPSGRTSVAMTPTARGVIIGVAVLASLAVVMTPSPAVATPVKVQPKSGRSCVYGNQTYAAGDVFRPEPCSLCHCPHHHGRGGRDGDSDGGDGDGDGEGGGGGGRARCAVQDCRSHPGCIRATTAPGDCCATCLEIGCLDSHGGVYPQGAVALDTPCERCSCPPGGGRLVCEKTPCDHVNCVDYIERPGECCPTCPNGPNCYLGKRILSGGEVVRLGHCMVCHCPLEAPSFWSRTEGIQAVCAIGDCS